MATIYKKENGFTLIELLIAMAVGSIVLGAAYTVFIAQQQTYSNQQGVVDIQQDLRAGMYLLTREVRLAGYDEEGTTLAGMVDAGPGIMRFTMDIYNMDIDNGVDDDGDGLIDEPGEIGINDGKLDSSGEDVTYQLAGDADGNGLPDTLEAGSPQPNVFQRVDNLPAVVTNTLMGNIQAVGFAYAVDSDKDGELDLLNGQVLWAVDTDGDGQLDTRLDTNDDGEIDTADADGGAGITTIAISDIRMVRIWMLARSTVRDNGFRDQRRYKVGLNEFDVNDNFRRRLLTTSITCRNMGE